MGRSSQIRRTQTRERRPARNVPPPPVDLLLPGSHLTFVWPHRHKDRDTGILTPTTSRRSSASNSGSSNVSGTETLQTEGNAERQLDTTGRLQVGWQRISSRTAALFCSAGNQTVVQERHRGLRTSVRSQHREDLCIEPHDGPRDDFSRRIPHHHGADEAAFSQDQAAVRGGFLGAADQGGVLHDGGQDETSLDLQMGPRAQILRGQSIGGTCTGSEPEIHRQAGFGTDASGDGRDDRQRESPKSESLENDSMHGWKFLLSLVKAKLLANDGRGRKLTVMCGGLLSQTYEKTLRRYPGTLLTSMVLEENGPLFYSDKVYLDRHPLAFVEILNAYREGVIAEQPTHIAPETWIHELVHFRMHRANIPAINDLLERYGVHAKKVSSNTAQA